MTSKSHKKQQEGRSPKQRVVLVTDLFPTVHQPYIIERFVRLRDLGWDVRLVCLQADDAAWSNIPVLAAHPKLRKRVTVPGISDLGQAVESLAPDLVHAEFAQYATPLLVLRRKLGYRVIASFRTYDPQLLGSPKAYRSLWSEADAIHAVSEHLWTWVQKAGCPSSKTHAVIPPGVDGVFFDPGARLHDLAAGDSRPLRVLSIGRLHWSKGYDYGLHAIRLLLDQGMPCEYRIVGRGEFRPAINHAIADFGLGRAVQMRGTHSPAGVREQLLWADVLLHASVAEAFGNVMLEAQAMMLPVVCTNAGGLPEAVADGQTAIVVPRRDSRALADALLRLARDPEERQRLGAAGRRRTLEHFTQTAHAGRFDAFYRKVLGSPPA